MAYVHNQIHTAPPDQLLSDLASNDIRQKLLNLMDMMGNIENTQGRMAHSALSIENTQGRVASSHPQSAQSLRQKLGNIESQP